MYTIKYTSLFNYHTVQIGGEVIPQVHERQLPTNLRLSNCAVNPSQLNYSQYHLRQPSIALRH